MEIIKFISISCFVLEGGFVSFWENIFLILRKGKKIFKVFLKNPNHIIDNNKTFFHSVDENEQNYIDFS